MLHYGHWPIPGGAVEAMAPLDAPKIMEVPVNQRHYSKSRKIFHKKNPLTVHVSVFLQAVFVISVVTI